MKEPKSHDQEFGGAKGAFGLILFSHLVLYYFWISQQFYNGALIAPQSISDIKPFFQRMANHIIQDAYPTKEAVGVYFGFLILQVILAFTMPGITVDGLPIPSEEGKKLKYLCNAVWGWWITLFIAASLHISGTFRLTWIADHFGSLMTTAIISANIFSLIIYYAGISNGKAIRMSGNFLYDFFMGSYLNPRIGVLDLKMWAEIRISWILLFLLTCSAACKQYEEQGRITPSMAFMVLAHFLYTNACQKGEECIPLTWDIFYEKFGWMLIFWNFAGVPFLYCFQSFYILRNNIEYEHSSSYYLLYAALLGAYYVWDTAQSQKARFRMQLRGAYQPRLTFPQLPWGTLENPSYIKTKSGGTILTDGWFRYARKIYYTADFVMALSWGLSCYSSRVGALPFFYPAFFGTMLFHRYLRDVERCKNKYGEDWDKYCQKVPYAFFPGVF